MMISGVKWDSAQLKVDSQGNVSVSSAGYNDCDVLLRRRG